MRAWARACVRACMRACVRACVLAHCKDAAEASTLVYKNPFFKRILKSGDLPRLHYASLWLARGPRSHLLDETVSDFLNIL